jgi:hypothetical protein
MVFIVTEKESQNSTTLTGGTAWCEFPKEPYFTEYMMEGVTSNENEIYLQAPTGR